MGSSCGIILLGSGVHLGEVIAVNESDWLALMTFASIAFVVVVWALVQAREGRRRRAAVGAALNAARPEVAQSLPATPWSPMALRALVMVALGLAAMAAGAWRPTEWSALLLGGGVLLIAFAPLVVYAIMRGRGASSPTLGAALVACLLIVLVTGVYGYVLYPAVWSTRAQSIQRQLQATPEGQEFSRRVQQVIGAPAGTTFPIIQGHRAESRNLGEGSRYGMHTYDDTQLRFTTIRPGFMHVYWVRDLQQYFVIGEVRVEPGGATVKDGYIPRARQRQPLR